MAALSGRSGIALAFALFCLAWGAAVWVAAGQAPVSASARAVSGLSMSAELLPATGRPDGRKPLEPTQFGVEELALDGLEALDADAQALALAVLNVTTGACDPCQREGLSIAACLRASPPGCENMPALAARVVRLAASSRDVNAVRSAVRYDDSWLPIPAIPRPAKGGGGDAVLLVVAVDYISPFSAEADALVDALLQRFGDQLRVEVLQVPRPDRLSEEAALAALAAERAGCFWPAHAALVREARQGDPGATVQRACGRSVAVEAEQAASLLRAHVAQASALGVRGTPTVFVNGYRVRGLRGADAYIRLIELELADREG